jgi:hypothetical protein
MKPSLAILILAVLGLGSLAATSCLVTRRSDGFACTSGSDCESGRSCDNGYCVPSPCPSQCTSCDLVDKTCRIECSANRPCPSVQCPAGYDCTIKCSSTNACGGIDCGQSIGCTITCSTGSACGNINCGTAPCDISCSGPSACPSIDCAASCRCDVDCNNNPNVCPNVSCPLDDQGAFCAKGGVSNAPCDSTAAPGCGTC